ncbi:MAG: hypothetical protein R2845_00935 [Thermomicrobiales bacterium]
MPRKSAPLAGVQYDDGAVRWTMDDLDRIVEEVTGVASFIGDAEDADITLFI